MATNDARDTSPRPARSNTSIDGITPAAVLATATAPGPAVPAVDIEVSGPRAVPTEPPGAKAESGVAQAPDSTTTPSAAHTTRTSIAMNRQATTPHQVTPTNGSNPRRGIGLAGCKQ